MKRAAPLVLALLFLACSSATDVIDERMLDCESGQDISVMGGIDGGIREQGIGNDRLEFVVEVSNNSHDEVTVKFIRVEQQHTEDAPFRLENTYRRFDQLIPEGEDHTFRLPTTGRHIFQDPRRVTSASTSQGLEVAVTVGLTNGDSYRCGFAIPVR